MEPCARAGSPESRALRRVRFGCVLLGLLSSAAQALAQGEPRTPPPVGRWYPIDNEDGVQVSGWRRPGRGLPVLRGIGTVDAGLYALAAVLRDADRFDDWIPHVVDSGSLADQGGFDFRFHLVLGTPWPLADYDVVVQVDGIFDPSQGVLVARFEDAKDPRAPPCERCVRVRRLFGEYRLTALSATRTEVSLVIDVDPGGNLPRWLVAAVIRDLPRDAIVSLRDRVRGVGARYAKLIDSWSKRYGRVPRR